MARKTRRVLRRQGFKLEPLSVVSLRIQPEIWERCAYAAEAKGMNRNEYVRTTLADASRDAQPPNGRKFRALAGSETEWAAWSEVAEQRGERVEDTIRAVMKRAVKLYEEKRKASAA